MSSLEGIPLNTLISIFEYVEDYKTLSLVSKYLKELIENYHIFSGIKIERKKDNEVYQSMKLSKRIYRSLTVILEPCNDEQFQIISDVLVKNQKTIKTVIITLKQVDHESLELPVESLHKLLNIVNFVEELEMKISWIEFKKPNWDQEAINFNKLKCFKIVYKSHNNWENIENFLCFLETPVLENLQVNFTGRCDLPKCPQLFEFAVRNRESLKRVNFDGSFPLSIFSIQEDSLIVHCWERYKGKIQKILENSNHLLNTEEINLLPETVPRHYDILTYLSFLNVTENSVLPNVRKFTTSFFVPNESNLTKLSRILPNLEEFTCLVCRSLSAEMYLLMKGNFKYLKMINNHIV